jgi:hypothetical protein
MNEGMIVLVFVNVNSTPIVKQQSDLGSPQKDMPSSFKFLFYCVILHLEMVVFLIIHCEREVNISVPRLVFLHMNHTRNGRAVGRAHFQVRGTLLQDRFPGVGERTT